MSCAYRIHRYRASVTAHPPSVSWQYPTGHARHPVPLRPPVVYPHRQAVTETSTSANDAPIPVSLVQYLCLQWQALPSVREQYTVAAILGELMRSPHWHWHVTVLRDQSPPDPQGSFVSERAGRPTIGIPFAMLQDLWVWVLSDIDKRASVLRWWVPTIDPALWQELRTHQQGLTKRKRYRLYGYLSPVLLPDIAHTAHDLLSSADPDDQQMTLTVLEQWLASDDHATRCFATHMLTTWLHAHTADGAVTDDHLRPRLRALTILAPYDNPAVVSAHLYHLLRTARNRITLDDVHTIIDLLHGCGDGRPFATDRWRSLLGEMVRDHPSDVVIRAVLDGMMPAILSSVCPDDRAAWVTTLWGLMTDPTCSDGRRLAIADALRWMMQQDPTGATLVRSLLSTMPPLHPSVPAPVWDTLLAGLMTTAEADAALDVIEMAIRQNRHAIARFAPLVAPGWGHGHDHRILQIITSHPSPDWREVLTQGITTSVSTEVCGIIQSQVPRDQASAMIAIHIHAREERGNWPLAPLPAHLIPWVCDAARSYPAYLSSNTIRRLWRADPDRAWNMTWTMLHSGHHHSSVQQCAIAAMNAGWGRGHDDTIAATLRQFILHPQSSPAVVETGIATAVAGIGIAPPSLIASLLTELAMKGNETVRRQLISALRRGWGRGQDDLVARVLAIIADQTVSERVWNHFHETLIRAWDCHPPDVVVSLIDRLLTHAMNGLVNEANLEDRVWMGSMAEDAIAAFAPVWSHLPTAQVIDRIAHHVARLHAHAHTLDPSRRDELVSAWAQVIAAGAERLSASDIHALLSPLWDLSPERCLDGVKQWVCR